MQTAPGQKPPVRNGEAEREAGAQDCADGPAGLACVSGDSWKTVVVVQGTPQNWWKRLRPGPQRVAAGMGMSGGAGMGWQFRKKLPQAARAEKWAALLDSFQVLLEVFTFLCAGLALGWRCWCYFIVERCPSCLPTSAGSLLLGS